MKNKVIKYVKIIFFVLLITNIIENAWLCDDAYISFRVVKNVVNGFGLRWNIIERVQVFTNPLMVLMLIPCFFVTHEIYYTSIIFSIIMSSLAIYLLMFKISKNDLVSILISIFLLSSESFMSFTTSGLENCLTFLLLAIFYYIFFKKETYLKKDILLLSFISSLILLNRMDSILLVIPSLIFVFIKRDKNITFLKFVLCFLIGMIPFIMWETFSLVYYGFLFPNTYYAKMNGGIPEAEYIIRGLKYLVTIFLLDSPTIIIILFGTFLIFVKKGHKYLCAIIGIIISIVYVVYVGGDFMLGRFLTPAFFTTLICFSKLELGHYKTALFKIIFMLGITLFIICSGYYKLHFSKAFSIEINGVANERQFYFKTTSLLLVGSEEKIKNRTHDKEEEYSNNVYTAGNIGFIGYFAKDDDYIIDVFALSDPFLARIPQNSFPRIGHIGHIIPEGYPESIVNNKNLIEDPDLKNYYDVIKIITQDKIFSKKRLKTIIKYQLGKYNYLIDNYIKKQS